jgi:hypothetical protein
MIGHSSNRYVLPVYVLVVSGTNLCDIEQCLFRTVRSAWIPNAKPSGPSILGVHKYGDRSH